MTRLKFIEIRDRNTFIPAVAVDCSLNGVAHEDYLLRRAGYGTTRCILLTSLCGHRRAEYDCYNWGDRTWTIAHGYIEAHWDEIADGQVVDVEFILGERAEAKLSEQAQWPSSS